MKSKLLPVYKNEDARKSFQQMCINACDYELSDKIWAVLDCQGFKDLINIISRDVEDQRYKAYCEGFKEGYSTTLTDNERY